MLSSSPHIQKTSVEQSDDLRDVCVHSKEPANHWRWGVGASVCISLVGAAQVSHAGLFV